jgi:lipoate---protein ligase
MLCFKLENNDPFFCLAAEEYLLKNFSEDFFMIWQSRDTVVVGKHQNLLAEANYPFCLKNNIALARRISGGGTVYHDPGNVNFSFIKNVANPHEINFLQFTKPIREALKELGVDAEISGKNDLVVSGLKISGNAQHIYKNRVLHHGTLLFSSDLQKLGQALKTSPGKYQSKAVQSNRSPVANISSFLKKEMAVEEFARFLLGFQLLTPGNSGFILPAGDMLQIQKSAHEKFSTFEWRFGYSPPYIFKNDVSIEGKNFALELSVKQGAIEECRISGTYFPGREPNPGQYFIGKKHRFEEIKETLAKLIESPPGDLAFSFF